MHVLLKALTAGAALELIKVHLVCTLHPFSMLHPLPRRMPVQVHLGGNSVSGSGEAGSVWLKQLRPDLEVDWEDRLPDDDAQPGGAQPLCR